MAIPVDARIYLYEQMMNLIGRVLADCDQNHKVICQRCELDVYKDDWCGCTGPDVLRAILSKSVQSSASMGKEEPS